MKKIAGRLSKLDDQSLKMVFLVYELGCNDYRCLDLVAFKLHISRDVIFEESKGRN